MSTPDKYITLLETSITTKSLTLGRLLHARFIKTTLTLNIFLVNRLITLYTTCNSLHSALSVFHDLPIRNTHSYNTLISSFTQFGFLDKARHLFAQMPNPNIVSYNSMISGLSRNGYFREAIEVFREMQTRYNGVAIDKFTVVGVVSALGNLGELEMLRQVHCGVINIGLELNRIMKNALIDGYGKCGEADMAYKVFSGMDEGERDVVSWTSMVVGFAWSGEVERACSLFGEMPVKNAVSWTALIAGLAQNGRGDKALGIFVEMQEEGFEPSASTFVSVLSACADLALIERGKQIHGHVVRSSTRSNVLNVFMFNALIDMYTKCGDMKSARILFEMMPEKDTVSWNSLVTGFAQNGCGKESLTFFEKMIDLGYTPNHVTFLGVLSACSHMGLVSEGYRIFHLMEHYGLCPRSDHYALLIDMCGRKNRLEEALALIQSAPAGSDQIGMWGALLSACRAHGNSDHAGIAAKALFKLEPGNSSRYIMLSNIYAAAGRWRDARQIRNLMNERGLRKETAFSWIEVRNARHGFVAEDQSHAEKEEIYDVIAKLAEQMAEAAHQFYNRDLFHPDEVECYLIRTTANPDLQTSTKGMYQRCNAVDVLHQQPATPHPPERCLDMRMSLVES